MANKNKNSRIVHNPNKAKDKAKKRMNKELKFYKDQLYGEERKENPDVVRIDALKCSAKYYNKILNTYDSAVPLSEDIKRKIVFKEKMNE